MRTSDYRHRLQLIIIKKGTTKTPYFKAKRFKDGFGSHFTQHTNLPSEPTLTPQNHNNNQTFYNRHEPPPHPAAGQRN
jgi:hypothetical protein